ncbi:MAG: pyridoxal phosphate-dependent aminotransferase [Propionibacteriaceae bacterium]|nr:pyridoxal phosphate-dependent aminotransferase [Propionibacteriaceae bacterium]
MLSRRFGINDEPNELAQLRTKLLAKGVSITDLTDTNPTTHGFLLPQVAEVLATTQVTEYTPDPKGLPSARAALAARFGGTPDDYWLTASTSEAYSWLFALLTDPGDTVAVPVPGYPLFGPLAQLAGINLVGYPAHYLAPDGWVIDTAALRVVTRGAKAVIAVNPNNPTGAYLTPAALAALVELEKPLIIDEVFQAFDFRAAPEPLPEVANSFTLNGLSKLLCAPHLKLGWIKASPDVSLDARECLDLIADTYLSVNQQVAAALPQLLDLADESVKEAKVKLQANLAAWQKLFPGRVRVVEGGWMALIDLDAGAAGAGEPAVELLAKHHFYAHPGWFYDIDDEVLAVSLLAAPPAGFEPATV